MACVRRLPTGDKWDVIQFLGTDPATGKQRRRIKRFYDKKSAELYAARMTQLAAEGSIIPDRKLTVAAYIQRWLDDREPVPGDPKASPVSPSTQARHRDFARRFVIPHLGPLKLARLSPGTIENFYKVIRTEHHLSGTTVRILHRMLHKAFRDAVRRGVLARNPCSVEAMDPPRPNDFEAKIWDYEQARLFLAEARRASPFYALYLFALTTGAREGEILGLSWANVNLTLGEATITRTLYRLKAFKQPTRLLIGPPKTKNGNRSVPLIPALVDELRLLRDVQQKHREALGEAYDPDKLNLVFCQSNGKPLHVRNLMMRDFFPTIERAKVPRCRFHDLRHATASWGIGLGVDINTLSKLLGHASGDFTMRQYVGNIGTRTATALKRDAVQRLGAQLFPTTAEAIHAPA